jgi:hypothetical protein
MCFSLGEGRICSDPQTHPDKLRARPRSYLTFGNRSDWSQNVRAAGGCSLRLNGRDCDATRPEFLSLQEEQPLVRAAFSPLERASVRMLGQVGAAVCCGRGARG